ncbi:DUF3347 domain-containing protein [Leptospira jelokensis]|uniref:DUF3347 domain-containing protein n=1 Tax=Leptospira jelokensis TaxID=2484931 RepID=A0A4Z1A3L6_9LEPT|nr:DUF3347 domain-containing protein [Leptospira jelokensis]TGL74969.1 DUF3347 domain-containing protein [Leptospira jelokensis]TGM02250.1 DUF3347 domain-containing protein [Leptospira jelokensis]
MKVFRISLLVFAFFAISCKEVVVPFDANHEKMVDSLLIKNQAILEVFLNENPKPDWKDFSNAVQSLMTSNHPKLKSWGEAINVQIPTSETDLDTSYEKISKIQEILIQIKAEVPNQSKYNRFYCPMVDKSWLMTGKEVKNPYAPEMRDCGELMQ